MFKMLPYGSSECRLPVQIHKQEQGISLLSHLSILCPKMVHINPIDILILCTMMLFLMYYTMCTFSVQRNLITCL